MAYAYLVKMYTIFLIEKAKKINYTLPANALNSLMNVLLVFYAILNHEIKSNLV